MNLFLSRVFTLYAASRASLSSYVECTERCATVAYDKALPSVSHTFARKSLQSTYVALIIKGEDEVSKATLTVGR